MVHQIVYIAVLGAVALMWGGAGANAQTTPENVAGVTYVYDELGRLVSANYLYSGRIVYDYDANGNRESVSVELDDGSGGDPPSTPNITGVIVLPKGGAFRIVPLVPN